MSEEKVESIKTKDVVNVSDDSKVENITKNEISKEKEVENKPKRSLSEDATNSKDDEDTHIDKKQKIEEKPVEKPKFVFGGASSFSQGFKFNKDMIPSNIKKKEEKEAQKDQEKSKETTEKPSPVFGTFGSSTSFGQGFGLLKEIQKKKETTDEEPPNESKSEGESKEIENKPVLKKLETVENGEENEDIVFNSNTKMYSLTSLKEGWKERGVGPMHLNYNKEADSYRLVIRQRLTFQVLLNLKIVKGIKIYKGFPGSSNSEKFVRMVVTLDKQVVQYCMKLNSEEVANKLFDKLESLV